MFLNNWKENGLDDMIGDFKISHKDIDGCRILLATYEYEDYSGYGYVLFEKEGKLFEVIGNHCSCYGLEGQWTPEETTVEAVRHRLDSAYEFDGCRDELRQALDYL